VPVRDVVGHLAQAVHVVRERDKPRLDLVIGEDEKSMTNHRGARDLAECPDMRQAGRTIAGLEDHLVLGPLFQARDDLARLLERPGVRIFRHLAQGWNWVCNHRHRSLRPRTLKSTPPAVNRNAVQTATRSKIAPGCSRFGRYQAARRVRSLEADRYRREG